MGIELSHSQDFVLFCTHMVDINFPKFLPLYYKQYSTIDRSDRKRLTLVQH